MRNRFVAELLIKAKSDPSIMLLTGDLGYSVVEAFQKELPKQFLNMGITEQSTMSFAAGLAKQGFRPFVYSIANFPTFRCFEQIRNDVNFMNTGVTVVAVGAGFAYGTAGYSHHLVEDLGALRTLGNLEIESPKDPNDVAVCLTRILDSKRPAYLRLGRGGDANLENHIKFEDDFISNPAKQGSFFFTGSIGEEVIKARDILSEEGIEVEVVSFSNLSRIPAEKLAKMIDSKPFITIEEHVLASGFGSLILEKACESSTTIRCSRVGIARIKAEASGDTQHLRATYGLDGSAIVSKFKELLSRN